MSVNHMRNTPLLKLTKALTIATSDSGGGAGIQADLKTFAALGSFGLSVICGVSAQNTLAVTGLEFLSPELVTLQLKAVFDDIGVNAIKIGLIGNAANTKAVVNFLEKIDPRPPIILDPVMVSASGHTFLEKEAIEALKELFPLVTLLTPNMPEAEVLTGITIKEPEDFIKAGQLLLDQGLSKVLIKGGHSTGNEINDLLIDSDGHQWFTQNRVMTKNNHGTGCTLSSAIAAFLAQGSKLVNSIEMSKQYVAEAMEESIDLGAGPGPLNHFYFFYSFAKN
jgi:hydroxymethylpyrimidine/phosphomethylpyrimidine kinase